MIRCLKLWQTCFRDSASAFEQAGFFCFSFDHWEADDVAASISVKAARNGSEVTIMSTDKGFFQLAGDKIRILNHFERRYYTKEDVIARYGIRPGLLCDLWGMTGDSTNNLPGVHGVGIRTATTLLQEFGDLDTLLIRFSEEGVSMKPAVKAAFEKDWQSALLSRKLAGLTDDLPLGINLGQMRLRGN